MSSMYQGREKFTREQLVFVVEAALAGAFDKVDGALPQSEDDKPHFRTIDEETKNFAAGAVAQIGIFVPILYYSLGRNQENVGATQLNQPDGMGTCEFHGWSDFEAMVKKFQADKWADPGIFHPNCRALAEKIIDENFVEYLGTKPDFTITIETDVVVTTTSFDSEGGWMTDQYSETMESGQEVELNPEDPWSSAVGGDEHMVTIHPSYPNTETYTLPLWYISPEDRKRLGMGHCIPAEIHSDDHAEKAEFDALLWFKQASDDEIVDLASVSFRGDYQADEVARHLDDTGMWSDQRAGIDRVLDYARGTSFGFEVSINQEAAGRWIENERPHLMARIDGK
jgi:hypothetical protein